MLYQPNDKTNDGGHDKIAKIKSQIPCVILILHFLTLLILIDTATVLQNAKAQLLPGLLPSDTTGDVSSIGAAKNSNNNNNGMLTPSLTADAKHCSTDQHTPTNAISYLTHFSCGSIVNGIRHFSLYIKENVSIPIADISTNNPVIYNAWTFNGSIPGPTMRMTEGDHVQIRVYNDPTSVHAHSFHVHSIHQGMMDGVMGMGGTIPPGRNYTYDFIAKPYGLYPYHCHVSPVQSHINHGLYGVMIIDPKLSRPPAKEMVMMMNGYNMRDDINGSVNIIPPTQQQLSTNFAQATEDSASKTGGNTFYTVNGITFIYRDHPIHLIAGQNYRIYLVNMLDFDLINAFHIHGTMFHYVPSGTALYNFPMYNDVVTMSQGDRGILEFKYDYPGMYMIHAHNAEFTDLGWMGMFDVTPTGVAPFSNQDVLSLDSALTKW